MNCALPLVARREAAELVEQVAFEWRDADGEVRTHFIDFVVEQHDGRRIGYAVQPEDRVSADYVAKLARIKRQVAAGFLSDREATGFVIRVRIEAGVQEGLQNSGNAEAPGSIQRRHHQIRLRGKVLSRCVM